DRLADLPATQPSHQRLLFRFGSLAQRRELAETVMILERDGERVEERPEQLKVPRLEALAGTGEHDQDTLKAALALERADQRFCAPFSRRTESPRVLGSETSDTVCDLTASAPGQESCSFGRRPLDRTHVQAGLLPFRRRTNRDGLESRAPGVQLADQSRVDRHPVRKKAGDSRCRFWDLDVSARFAPDSQ